MTFWVNKKKFFRRDKQDIMNYIKINNCVSCPNHIINNSGHMSYEIYFYIECRLDAWKGQRMVRIGVGFADIPDECPLIEKDFNEE